MKIIESTLRSAVQNGLIGSFYVESDGFTFRVVEGMKSEFPLVFVIDVVLVFFTRFDFDLISLSAGCGTVGHLQVPPLVQYQRLNWLQTTVTFLAKRAVNASIWISVAMASTTALMDPMRKDAVSSFWFFVYFVIFSFFFFFFFFCRVRHTSITMVGVGMAFYFYEGEEEDLFIISLLFFLSSLSGTFSPHSCSLLLFWVCVWVILFYAWLWL